MRTPSKHALQSSHDQCAEQHFYRRTAHTEPKLFMLESNTLFTLTAGADSDFLLKQLWTIGCW